MSKRDIRLQAESWVDHPQQLLADVKRFHADLSGAVSVPGSSGGSARQQVLRLTPAQAAAILAPLDPLEPAINEYRRLTSESPLDARLVLDLLDRLRDVDERGLIEIPRPLLAELDQTVAEFERWCRFQSRQETTPLRSELLKTTIELSGDEVLVLTDGDGSLKLRGATTVPMFLAFWRAPGHRLGQQAFLDIDRASSQSSLERHSTRLCSKLQDVWLEVVKAGTGFQLRKCARK